jgi:hypothetical protein
MMDNNNNTFLALVPHRDTRLELRRYSETLFCTGYTGAYSFPWVVPLAALLQPLSGDELKHCARAIREASQNEKIEAVQAALLPLDGEKTLFGPRLNIDINLDMFENAAQKIKNIFSPPVIGACFISANVDTSVLPPPPNLSFRAAAIANMYRQSYETGGAWNCSWQIGRLAWLPKTKTP